MQSVTHLLKDRIVWRKREWQGDFAVVCMAMCVRDDFVHVLTWVPICMPIGFVPRLMQAFRCNCNSNWWSDNPISTGNVPRFPRPRHHHPPVVAQPTKSSPWERCTRQLKFPGARQVDEQTDKGRQRNKTPHMCSLPTHWHGRCCRLWENNWKD